MVFLGCVRLEKQKAGKNREAERWRRREAKKQGNRSQENTQHGKK